MAIEKRLVGQLDFDELEFLAESTLIDIKPNFKMDRLEMATGSIGPFKPPFKSKVPIWVALIFRQKNKCTIVQPEWLTVEKLTEVLNKEKEEPGFSDIYQNYIEISKKLLEEAKEDIKEENTIRILLKDIQEIRESKIRKGLKFINPSNLQMDNLTRFEINLIKPIFNNSFNTLNKIRNYPNTTPHHLFQLGIQNNFESSQFNSNIRSSNVIQHTPIPNLRRDRTAANISTQFHENLTLDNPSLNTNDDNTLDLEDPSSLLFNSQNKENNLS